MTRHQPTRGPAAAANDQRYLDELTLQLRLADLPGSDIGAVLEEVRDHLAHTDATPAETFGPAEDYAREIVAARGTPPVGPLGMSLGDLLAAALQILGWFVLIYSGVAWLNEEPLTLGPGHLAGLLVLVVGFAWPVWPTLRAHASGRVGWPIPVVAAVATFAVAVGAMSLWHTPTLLTVPAPVAITVAATTIIGCWVRAYRHRDPVRQPGSD